MRISLRTDSPPEPESKTPTVAMSFRKLTYNLETCLSAFSNRSPVNGIVDFVVGGPAKLYEFVIFREAVHKGPCRRNDDGVLAIGSPDIEHPVVVEILGACVGEALDEPEGVGEGAACKGKSGIGRYGAVLRRYQCIVGGDGAVLLLYETGIVVDRIIVIHPVEKICETASRENGIGKRREYISERRSAYEIASTAQHEPYIVAEIVVASVEMPDLIMRRKGMYVVSVAMHPVMQERCGTGAEHHRTAYRCAAGRDRGHAGTRIHVHSRRLGAFMASVRIRAGTWRWSGR